jgi:hypothetical protein
MTKAKANSPFEGFGTSPQWTSGTTATSTRRPRRSAQPGYTGLDPATRTVGHVAFEVGLPDCEAEKWRLALLGLAVETAEHAWVRWRSLYLSDPESNMVKLVCSDPPRTTPRQPSPAGADFFETPRCGNPQPTGLPAKRGEFFVLRQDRGRMEPGR